MTELINKIWSYFVRRRTKKFAKSPVICTKDFSQTKKKYFRLRAKSKVISIGNLNFGGTGKTPLIVTLVSEFLPKNKKIGIVAKGYKRAVIQDLVLTEENFSDFTINQIGDEPLMLFNRLKVPISISQHKYLALINLEKTIHPDITIVDDGYQHLWIERDLNILLIDIKVLNKISKNSFILLREPLSSIERADLVMMPLQQNIKLTGILPNLPIIHFHFELDKIKPEFLYDQSKNNYIAFAGIANPQRFFNTLYEHNIDPIKKIKFGDHHNYTKDDIAKLISLAKRKKADLITTEKDFVKIQNFEPLFAENNINLHCLYIKFEIIEKDLFSQILKQKLNV